MYLAILFPVIFLPRLILHTCVQLQLELKFFETVLGPFVSHIHSAQLHTIQDTVALACDASARAGRGAGAADRFVSDVVQQARARTATMFECFNVPPD